MARKEPATWTMIFIDHGAWILFVCFLVLAVLAYIWGQFAYGDTIAIAIGIIVALAQVLLVYKLVEPTLDAIKENTAAKHWKDAVREFLALCSMSARDLSHGLAYHIEESNNGNGVIVLRQGIVEVLQEVPIQAQAFDTMARLCSSAFSDKELAELSQISAELRSCAINASSAAKRLEAIEVERKIEPFDAIKESEIESFTYRRADLKRHPHGLERQCCWFVRDIDEMFEPMIEACEKMKSLFNESMFKNGDRIKFISESKRYERAKRKQVKVTEARLRELGISEDNFPERMKSELQALENKVDESVEVDKHEELIDQSIKKLRAYNNVVEQKGICLAWLPDEPPQEQDESDDPILRA